MGEGAREEQAVRKTACNQLSFESFETTSERRTQQTTFLIDRQNVNLSADVRFPEDKNFKGVPSFITQLT